MATYQQHKRQGDNAKTKFEIMHAAVINVIRTSFRMLLRRMLRIVQVTCTRAQQIWVLMSENVSIEYAES
jgi:hypothetical protein